MFATGVRQVAIGTGHACAVLTNSSRVSCCGYNSEGELGDGTLLSSDAPLDVPGL